MRNDATDKRELKAVSFDEFKPHTYEQWKEEAISALKGAPFEKKLFTKTYEGITLEPLYTQEKSEQPENIPQPGFAPYVRGTTAGGYIEKPWMISQYVNSTLPERAGEVLREELSRGNGAIHLSLSRSTLSCEDDLRPGDRLGLHIVSPDDLAAVLGDIEISKYPLHIYTGPSAVPALAMLDCLAKKRGDAEALKACKGFVGADPNGFLAEEGELPAPMETLYDEMAQAAAWSGKNMPGCRTILVRGDAYHNGGANVIQEVAYCFATAIEYVNALSQRGLEIDVIASQIAFSFSIGANFFMEIAKLRAARGVWSQIVSAFGGSDESGKLCALARTSEFTTTAYDPYVNILRASSQTFSGVVGGIDALSVTPFDEAVRASDAQSRRIARNIQLMFQSEFDMMQPVDPAGGSWYVESLTASLAKAIWAEVQNLDAKGGMLAALRDGSVQAAVAEVLKARQKSVATRADRIVGSNMYANMTEQPLESNEPGLEELSQLRKKAVADFKAGVNEKSLSDALEILGAAEDSLSAASAAFSAGATLSRVRECLNRGKTGDISVTPIKAERLTQQFEELRRATEEYEAKTGKTVDIFLANMGPVPQHKARADFITGFMEVAHFKVLGNDGFASVEDAAKAAIESSADNIVICSSDPTYPELVPQLARLIKQGKPKATVFLAGAPAAEHKDSYLEAGVDDFIHVKSDCYAMLTAIQEKEGVR